MLGLQILKTCQTVIMDDDDWYPSNDGNVSGLIEGGAKYDIAGVQQQKFCAKTQELPAEEDVASRRGE